MRNTKALGLLAIHAMERVLQAESDWHGESGVNLSDFELRTEVQTIAEWYRECLKAVSEP